MYKVIYASKAIKDLEKLKRIGIAAKAKQLIDILKVNPFQNPPPYEKLAAALQGKYSRRINIQHRLVYEVDKENQIVKVLSMWSHYEF